MGRFDEKYTHEQRAAVVELINSGTSPKDAVAILTAGYGDLEPFDMPYETARHYARHARKVAPPEDPSQAMSEITKAAISIAHREIQRYNAQSETRKLDPSKFAAFLKAVESVDKLAKANRPGKKQQTDDEQTPMTRLASALPTPNSTRSTNGTNTPASQVP